MEKQNTPLQMSIDEITDLNLITVEMAVKILTELLPIEREVIEKAHWDSFHWNVSGATGEDYFNQTFID